MIKFKNLFKKDPKVEVEVNNPTNGLEDLQVEYELSEEDLNLAGGGNPTVQYYYEQINKAKNENERQMWIQEFNKWKDEQKQSKGGRHA